MLWVFSGLLCYIYIFCSLLVFVSVFFFLIRFLILQSYLQDWLLQCTHIAHLTACICPDMADLQKKTHGESNSFLGQLDSFTLKIFNYHYYFLVLL